MHSQLTEDLVSTSIKCYQLPLLDRQCKIQKGKRICGTHASSLNFLPQWDTHNMQDPLRMCPVQSAPHTIRMEHKHGGERGRTCWKVAMVMRFKDVAFFLKSCQFRTLVHYIGYKVPPQVLKGLHQKRLA